jgi:uncharacterized protein (TIGR00730 family)
VRPPSSLAGIPAVSFAVCVFCGSATGRDPRHAAAAVELGTQIARRGWTLVYCGGRVGLMGLVADAALAGGGRVLGVITRFLYDWEVGHDGLTSLEIVETLAGRKVRMGELADAFLTLPGGIGTLDEAFEALSWAQLGLAGKPNGLLNVAGYFDPLLGFLDRALEEGYLKPRHRSLLLEGTEPGALLDRLHAAAPRAMLSTRDPA